MHHKLKDAYINLREYYELRVAKRVFRSTNGNDFMLVILYESVVRWGKAECKRQKMLETPKYLRSVLETRNIIQLVRFPQMVPSDFTLIVAPEQVLTMEELVSVLLYFNVEQADR